MRACWAVQGEEAPGRGFFAVWVVAFPLSGFLRAYRFGLLYDTRSVRGHSIHPPSLFCKVADSPSRRPAAAPCPLPPAPPPLVD